MFALPPRQVKRLVDEHETKRAVYRFFSELAGSIRRVDLFEAIIASLIVTMLALAVGRFFLLPWYYAMPAPVLYLLVRVWRIQRSDVLRRTEKVFPEFREQLITIRDNFHRTHEMEEALERDVLDRSHDVVSAGFFDPRSFSMKIIVILLLFFVTGFFTQFTYHDVPPFWNVIFKHDPGNTVEPNLTFWQRAYLTGIHDSSNTNATDDVFQKPDELLQGTRDVPIDLKAAKNALDLSKSTDVTSQQDFATYTPTRIDAAGAEYYQESIPVNKHEVVQNYFKALQG